MARRKLSHEGTLVLDSEGLSKLQGDDETVVALVMEARARGMEAVISALTIIEAVHARTNMARLSGVLSGLRVIPVGDEEAKAASGPGHRSGRVSGLGPVGGGSACGRGGWAPSVGSGCAVVEWGSRAWLSESRPSVGGDSGPADHSGWAERSRAD